jgi:hypothetical protein
MALCSPCSIPILCPNGSSSDLLLFQASWKDDVSDGADEGNVMSSS